MAVIKWNGAPFRATPVQKLSNGDWLMRALEHGPRFTVDTLLQVKAADIISLRDEDTPDPAARAAELEAAMAEERKTLPTVMELLAKLAANNNPADLPDVPSPPIAPPTPQQDTTDMSKLSALADLAKSTAKDIDADAERAAARLVAAKEKASAGIGKIDSMADGLEAGIAAVEDMANQLTNGGPPLEK